jgi:hypothetical protein
LEEWAADPCRLALAPDRDNFAVIQSALNAAGRNGGGTVLVPPGNWPIGSTLYLPDNVALNGAGITASALKAVGIAAPEALVSPRNQNSVGWAIESLTLDAGAGPGIVTGAAFGIAVKSSASFGIVRRVRVRNVALDAIRVAGKAFHNIFIEQISFGWCGRSSLMIEASDEASGLFLSEISAGLFGCAEEYRHSTAIHLKARCHISQLHIDQVRDGQIGVLFDEGSDHSLLSGFYVGLYGGAPRVTARQVKGIQVSAESVRQFP